MRSGHVFHKTPLRVLDRRRSLQQQLEKRERKVIGASRNLFKSVSCLTVIVPGFASGSDAVEGFLRPTFIVPFYFRLNSLITLLHFRCVSAGYMAFPGDFSPDSRL
jgi:hypothetical protein